MSMTRICAFCGTDGRLIVGRTGVICRECLAKAITSVLEAQASDLAQLSASDRCLLCGDTSVSRGDYAAVRRPYSICATCMKEGLDTASGDANTFWVASF